MNRVPRPHQSPTGFTLVELSIVLVIVALVVGGVMVGRELMAAAQARAVMNELRSVELGISTFRGKYNCLPGDCAHASRIGMGTNGNGDGLLQLANAVETPQGLGLATCAADADRNMHAGLSCPPPWSQRSNGESQRFWYQLSVAGLITERITDDYVTPFSLSGHFPKFSSGAGGTHLIPFTWGGKTFIHTGLSQVGSQYSHPQFPTRSLKGRHVQYIMSKLGYPLIEHPACTFATCTYPPSLLAGQRVIASGVRPGDLFGFYLIANTFDSQSRPCAATVAGSYHYQSDGDCHLLWQID